MRDGTYLCTSLVCQKKIIKKLYLKYENTLWYKYSYLGKFIGNKVVEKRFTEYYVKTIKNSYIGSEREKKAWIKQQKYLKEMMNICKRRDIKFHLVIFPLLFGLESRYQFYDVENELSRFAKHNGIPIFSLTKGFIGQESKALWVSRSDQHPNEKGHLIAAGTLYPYMRKTLNF